MAKAAQASSAVNGGVREWVGPFVTNVGAIIIAGIVLGWIGWISITLIEHSKALARIEEQLSAMSAKLDRLPRR